MTSRERVQAAFAHSAPDRPPVDYFATPEIHAALCKHFSVQTDAEIREKLKSDIRYINPPYTGPALPDFDDGSVMNIWGIRKKPMPNEYGDYAEPVNYPYRDWQTVEEAQAFPWPDPDEYDYTAVPDLCAQFPGLAIGAGSFSVQDFINNIAYGRGVEQVLIDIASEDPVYLYIVEKRHQFYMRMIERILDAGKGRIDFILCGDDFGTQKGLLISPASFDKIFAGKKKELFDLVHSYGAKVSHHCCGSSRELFPRFIELGMDALQTIQPQAAGMDPYELKRDFGDKIVLHGGVDVQGWLQRAGRDEILEEVGRLRAALNKDGGFILSPCHNLQPDTPVENVLAMYEAAVITD
jgi:uroporphyrinogen decarboxylase